MDGRNLVLMIASVFKAAGLQMMHGCLSRLQVNVNNLSLVKQPDVKFRFNLSGM